MSTDQDQPLAGVQVLELATDVAGPFAAKMLAAFGGEVIKVEPPGGDPSRRHGPFPEGIEPESDEALEQSALFLHLSTDKRSIVADLENPADRQLITDLIRTSDVVIESFAPGVLDGHGLGFEAMRELNPAVVMCSFTRFGQDGPYAAMVGEDIVTYAMGGPMTATGTDDAEPVKLGGNLTTYQCGNIGATATLAAVMIAEQSGQGTHIDLSMFEAQAGSIDRRVTHLLWYLWSGIAQGRQPADRVNVLPVGFYPTLEGHALVFTIPAWYDRMLETLDDPELADRFANPNWMVDEDLGEVIEAQLVPWMFSHDKQSAAEDAQSHRWAVTPLNAPVDVIDDPHFVDRGFFVDVDHPVAGVVRQPGPPFRLGDSWRLRRAAPTLDQHAAEIRAEVAAHSRPARVPATPAEPRLPLEGVRVLDMTVVWAGPSCTMHLSDLGAEVIRVDNPWVFPTATRGNSPRPDPARLIDAGPLGGGYPNLDVSGRPWNKHGMWSAQARNKLSCTLDLRQSEGVEHFLRLVDHADLLVENNTVGVLDKLGIGWGVLHARNPRFIALRMPPMGLTGSYANWLGFGASFEALCGLTHIRGYRDGDPVRTTAAFHMDPTSGAAGAFAAMLALRRREATGQGELIEFPQSEVMMQHIGEYFVDAARTGRVHPPMGNRHVSRAPQGCYPCEGDDRWVVISVGTDTEWEGLVTAMGSPVWAADQRFRSAAGRREHHDELDELIEGWTRHLDRWVVTDRCQAHGVPAGPVMDEADAYQDPHLRARAFFRPQGSVDIGEWEFPGHQWRWTAPPMRWEPINRLGDANEYVWREVVGLTGEEYQALVAGGHISEDYLKPDGTPW